MPIHIRDTAVSNGKVVVLMAGYAENTKVSVAASKAEIETLFNRFGITDVMSGTVDSASFVIFKQNGKSFKIEMAMPDMSEERFWKTPGRGLARTQDQAYQAWEQECRVKWRELALLIKAKLVAISNEAVSFDREFLAYAMLPGNLTVGDLGEQQLQAFLTSGQLPPMLASRNA